METKIFLEGFDSKKSVNKNEGLNVELRGKRKLLPTNDVADVISEFEQYREERNACNIIRLTCQVNPICSNVLFNRVSEIVKDEGSPSVSFINYGVIEGASGRDSDVDYGDDENKIRYKKRGVKFWSGNTLNYQKFDADIRIDPLEVTDTLSDAIEYTAHTSNGTSTPSGTFHPTNAIRDMQLSNCGYVYHCGLDIMNNHLIRSKTFKCVCKMPDGFNPDDGSDESEEAPPYNAFNTIADLMRDINGDKVVEKIIYPKEAGVPNDMKFITMHLYKFDDIYTFEECVQKRLLDTFNGWIGFDNKPKIKTYEVFSIDHSIRPNVMTASIKETELHIERPIMYKNGGDFVDMYPDRSLYSFVPKFNHFRNRIEKNWNYCLTYPSSSTTHGFEDIIEESTNGLKAIYFDENTRSDNGTTQLVIYGITKHGLDKGDYVNIYNTYKTILYWVVEKVGEDEFKVSEDYENEADANTKLEILKADYPNGTFIPKQSETPQTVSHKVLDNAKVAEVVNDYIFTVFNGDAQISREWVEITKGEFQRGEFTVSSFTETGQVSETNYTLTHDRKTCYTVEDGERNDTYYIVNTHYGYYVNLDDRAQHLSYKKVVNDIECKYYVRIFSKIPNFKNASADTSNEYQIYKDNAELIDIYQNKEYDFENHVSRLAFAKNIYTDEVGEVVFTDDINIANLKDNLGRPLSSIYLTIVKNNMGYKEWYGYDSVDNGFDVTQITADTVEYSHCFGKVTCGIETSEQSTSDTNIQSIFKISANPNDRYGFGYKVGYDEDGEVGINKDREYVNDLYFIDDYEVWFNLDKHYYGDLSYYDNYNAIERSIQPIMHRFNTAQRESAQAKSTDYYDKFAYDEIALDDYDAAGTFEISSLTIDNANQKYEGYYYIPHYEIPIKTFDKVQTTFPDFLTMRSFIKVEGETNTYRINCLENHFLTVGDKAMLFDKVNNKYYDCITVRGEKDTYRTFTCKIYTEEGEEADLDEMFSSDDKLETFRLFKMDNLNIPSYAQVLRDGSCRVIWRDILNNGFNTSDDSVEEYPFTNGAFYVNRRVDLFVRRQDPFELYGLRSDDLLGKEIEAENDNYVKDKNIEC